MARLTGVNCGTAWSQTFTLDRWGNLAKSGNQSFGALYGTNNRISSDLGVVPQYDSDGNLLDDPATGAAVNSFDAEGHMTSLEGINVTYDALGRAVEASAPGGATVEFVYGPDGRKLAVMNGQTLVRADFPLPGGGEAAFTSGGSLIYLTHGDSLGSARLATNPAGGLYSSTAYAPYGETYTPANPSVSSFTGKKQDIAAGSYDFLMRELSQVQGRWWTPDPAGLAAVDPNNPQSWNRYAYVGGTPLVAIDPLGLDSLGCWTSPCSQSITVNGTYAGGALGGVGGGSGTGDKPGCWVRNEAPPLSDSTGVNGRLDTVDGPYDPGPMDDGCATSHTHNPGVWNPTQVVQPTPPPAPPAGPLAWWSTSWNWLKQKASCTVNKADEASWASGLEHVVPGLDHGAGKFITDAMFGNSITAYAGGFVNPSLANTGQLAVANLGYGEQAQRGLAEGMHAIIMSGGEITTLTGTVSTVTLTGAEYASGVGELKSTWDLGSIIVAGVGCTFGVWN